MSRPGLRSSVGFVLGIAVTFLAAQLGFSQSATFGRFTYRTGGDPNKVVATYDVGSSSNPQFKGAVSIAPGVQGNGANQYGFLVPASASLTLALYQYDPVAKTETLLFDGPPDVTPVYPMVAVWSQTKGKAETFTSGGVFYLKLFMTSGGQTEQFDYMINVRNF